MNRRVLLTTGALGILAGCSALSAIPVGVKVGLSPELRQPVADIETIIAKVESLGTSIPALATQAVAEAKALLAGLTNGNATSSILQIVSLIGTVAAYLPPPYGTIASAINTLLPLIGRAVGSRMAALAPTGMTPDQARAILGAR